MITPSVDSALRNIYAVYFCIHTSANPETRIRVYRNNVAHMHIGIYIYIYMYRLCMI